MSIPVERKVIPSQGSATGQLVEFGLNIDRAPVPPRRYAAEFAQVRPTPENVHLLFGQRKIVGNGVRSLVQVAVSFTAVRSFLKASQDLLRVTKDFSQTRALVASQPIDLGPEEPNQVVFLTVNIIAAAQIGREACLDMYNLSPFALRQLGKTKEGHVDIEPVLRVDCTSNALLSILEALEKLEPSLPTDQPIEHGTDVVTSD